jgi:hypothetical protein
MTLPSTPKVNGVRIVGLTLEESGGDGIYVVVGLLTQGVPGVPQDLLTPPSGPMGTLSGLTKTH